MWLSKNNLFALGSWIVLVCVMMTGCRGVGPGTIERDRFDYNAAIATSWKEQMLVNMVRLRYGEAPVFLDVASVISQYSVEGDLTASGGINTSFLGDDTIQLGGGGRWTDRPTITYTPRIGQRFTLSLLTPIAPSEVFSLVQTGWPVDLALRMTVWSINGVPSRIPGTGQWNPAYDDVLEAMSRVQKSGAVGLRHDPRDEDDSGSIVFRDVQVDEEIQRALTTLRERLGLDPEIDEYKLAFGAFPEQRDQIAVLTNSVLEMLTDVSQYFDVPPEHVEAGWTTPSQEPSTTDPRRRPLIRVRVTEKRPENTFVAVRNRGWWFSIDEADFQSKQMFSFLMVLLRLSESGERTAGPLVTVGAGG